MNYRETLRPSAYLAADTRLGGQIEEDNQYSWIKNEGLRIFFYKLADELKNKPGRLTAGRFCESVAAVLEPKINERNNKTAQLEILLSVLSAEGLAPKQIIDQIGNKAMDVIITDEYINPCAAAAYYQHNCHTSAFQLMDHEVFTGFMARCRERIGEHDFSQIFAVPAKQVTEIAPAAQKGDKPRKPRKKAVQQTSVADEKREIEKKIAEKCTPDWLNKKADEINTGILTDLKDIAPELKLVYQFAKPGQPLRTMKELSQILRTTATLMQKQNIPNLAKG